MRRLACIVCLWLGLCCGQRAWASAEREQQFTYHWYAAWEALQNQAYGSALAQLLFCEQLNPQDALTKEYIAVLYNAIGRTDEAAAYLKKAYELDPAKRWFLYSAALYRSGEPEQHKTLLKVAQKVVKLDAKNEDAWDNLRQAALVNKKYRLALSAQDEIDRLHGYDGMSALNRYRIYVMMGKGKKAVAEIDRYLALDPDNLQFWLLKVQVLEAVQAPFAMCEAAYLQVLRLDPNNLTALNNYAYLLAVNGGDLRKAEQLSQRTIREQPENPVFLDTYAWILHLQGQDVLAAFYIKKAVNNAPEEGAEEIMQHYRVIVKD